MDLLRIGADTVNLDRLSMMREAEDGSLKLVLGDTTVELDPKKAEVFRAFLAQNYPVRDLIPFPPRVSRGGVVPQSGNPGLERNEPGRVAD